MKLVRLVTILVLIFVFLFSTDSVNAAVIIDHNSVDKFNSIPDSYLVQAANIKLLLRHASVGSNIGSEDDPLSGLNVLQSSNSKYNRRNWEFSSRGNPSWQTKFNDLLNQVQSRARENINIFMMKLCFREEDKVASVSEYIRIMEAAEKYLKDNNYRNTNVIYWTMPITKDQDELRDRFNNSVRNYVKENNKILFDIADIESHHPDGSRVVTTGEALAREYEERSNHLNPLGRERSAKAMWVLMASMAGWDGSGARIDVSPTKSLDCAYKESGDSNCDNMIKLDDFGIWKREYLGLLNAKSSDYNKNGSVGLEDFVIWKKGYLGL